MGDGDLLRHPRWTDERLDDHKVSVDRAIGDLTGAVADLVPKVAGMQVSVEGLRDDVQEAIAEAKKANAAAQDAHAASAKGRRDMIVAVLGFAAPVTVALIGGVVAILLGGAP